MNDTQYTSVLVPYSLGNSKQPGFCPKKPFTKASKIHKTFWTFCLLSEQCASARFILPLLVSILQKTAEYSDANMILESSSLTLKPKMMMRWRWSTNFLKLLFRHIIMNWIICLWCRDSSCKYLCMLGAIFILLKGVLRLFWTTQPPM